MKYIRTKFNEIYNLDDFTKNDFMPNCYVAKYFNRCIHKDDIIKQADTIDKLCDTFVIIVDKQGYLIIDDYKKAMEIMQRNDNYNAICYGAIWCDWGLKYVAKMNKESELCLL